MITQEKARCPTARPSTSATGETVEAFASRVAKYLEAGLGVSHLRDPEQADLAANAIRFFDGQRYRLHAWVVMPHHAQVVVWPKPGHILSDVLPRWKSFTSRGIKKQLAREVAPFWQGESYDHQIRDDDHRHPCCHHTTMNPVNAGLCARPEDWKQSSPHVPPAWTPAPRDPPMIPFRTRRLRDHTLRWSAARWLNDPTEKRNVGNQ